MMLGGKIGAVLILNVRCCRNIWLVAPVLPQTATLP